MINYFLTISYSTNERIVFKFTPQKNQTVYKL